jgi:hypothetical protein
MKRLGLAAFVALAVVLSAIPASAAIAFVSRDQAGAAAAATSFSSGGVTHTAHNALIALIQWQGTLISITDVSNTADGSTWTWTGLELGSGNNKVRSYYIADTAGAATDFVSVTFDAAATYHSITVYEFSGITTASPLNSNTPLTNTGTGTTLSSGTVTLQAAAEVIVLFGEADNDSITNATYNLVNFGLVGDATKYFCDGYHIVTSGEAATATATSGPWYIHAVSFKGAGSSHGKRTLLGVGPSW